MQENTKLYPILTIEYGVVEVSSDETPKDKLYDLVYDAVVMGDDSDTAQYYPGDIETYIPEFDQDTPAVLYPNDSIYILYQCDDRYSTTSMTSSDILGIALSEHQLRNILLDDLKQHADLDDSLSDFEKQNTETLLEWYTKTQIPNRFVKVLKQGKQ